MYTYDGLRNQSLLPYIPLIPPFSWTGFVSLLEPTLRDPGQNGKETTTQSPQHFPGSCFFN